MIRFMFQRLLVEKDVPIPVRDGGTVSANVFRPAETGEFPVIMTLGPYPKDIHFREWNPAAWERLPGATRTCTGRPSNPEWWVPQGYVVIRFDTRGTGKSPGRPRHAVARRGRGLLRLRSSGPATQTWSNGKVAVMGDLVLRDERVARGGAAGRRTSRRSCRGKARSTCTATPNRHGGIFSSDVHARVGRSHAQATRPTAAQRPRAAAARADRPSCSRATNPNLADIEVPLLSAGNWGGAGLHLRGNVEGYLGAGSAHK